MSKRIDRYLEDLERRLSEKIPEPKLGETLRELGSHIEMSTRFRMKEGTDRDESERQALWDLGSARSLAEDLLRQHTGVDQKSVWRLARIPCLLFLLYICAGWAGLLLEGSVWLPLFFRLRGWLLYLVPLSLAVQAWRTRRWLFPAMATTIVVAGLTSMAIGFLVSRSQVNRLREGAGPFIQHNLDEVRREKEMANLPDPPQTTEGYVKLVPIHDRTSLQLPYLPVPVTISSTASIEREFTQSKEEAEASWTQFRIDFQRNLAVKEARLQRAAAGGPAYSWRFDLLQSILIHLLVLGGVNTATLALAEHMRRRQRRMDPHLT